AELKNLNSFRSIEKALEYEIERQAELIGRGGEVVQETRLFNVDEGATYSMRGKEEAHDYRYFPEPDLLPLIIDEAWEEEIRKGLPELQTVSNWIMSELLRELKSGNRSPAEAPLRPSHLAELLALVKDEVISGK